MPALVKSSVWSPTGTSGDDGTRVCPLRSKYLRKASRSSAPVMEASLYHPGRGRLRGAIAAGGARADPLPRECGIVDIAARDEIVHDLGGNFGRRAAPMQPRGKIGARPRAAGQQVARREAGGLGVEKLTRRYDFSGAGALRPSVSRILASRSLRTTGLSCSHLRAFSRPWPMRSVL